MLRRPLGASVTLSEATAPVKLPAWYCPMPGLRHIVRTPTLEEWYPKGGSTPTGVCASMPPTYPVHVLSKSNVKLQ